MALLAAELALTVLVPLFLGTVSVIHGLSGVKRNVSRSVLMAAGIWCGIALGTMAMLVGLTVVGSPIR